MTIDDTWVPASGEGSDKKLLSIAVSEIASLMLKLTLRLPILTIPPLYVWVTIVFGTEGEGERLSISYT
jgi:hypothetical protein